MGMKKVFGWFSFKKGKKNLDGNHESDKVVVDEFTYSGLYEDIVKEAFSDNSENGRIISNAFSVGCRCYNDGDNKNALLVFGEMHNKLEVSKEKSIVEFFMGLCHQELGNIEDAISLYKSALEYDDSCIEILNNLGVLLLDNGNTLEALKYLEHAVSLEDASEYEYVNLANAYLDMGSYDDAIKYAFKAIDMNESIVLAYEILTLAYSALEKREESMKYFNICVENKCEDIAILSELISQEVA